MFEIVKGTTPRKNVHAKIFMGVVPIWVVIVAFLEWVVGGASSVFQQNAALVVGGGVFFLLDFGTAVVYRIWIRGEESFNSQGLASGAKKLGLWVVIGAGATIWANTFPEDPKGVQWFNPVWLAANVDLLGFLYMYAVDLISAVENVTGKEIGQTGIGKFSRAVIGQFFPKSEEILSEAGSESS